MEPLSALSIAAAGSQFDDFANRLLSDTVEIYNSGARQTERMLCLRRLTSDLDSLTSQIEGKGLRLRMNTPPGSPDAVFLAACRQCKELSRALSGVLQTLASATASLTEATRHIVSEEKIKDFTSKLMALQAQIQTAALLSLWEKAQDEGLTIRQASQQLTDMVLRIERLDSTPREMATLLNDIVASDRSPRPATGTYGAQSDSHRLILNLCRWLGLRIVNSLAFDLINDREKSIPNAYRDTFQWLFAPQLDPDEVSAWLEADNQEMYCITGKLGSGKLGKALSIWAGSYQLLIACFYFWNAGNGLQKSHEGLLRTLLIQCLRQKPDVLPRVFEGRWIYMQMVGAEALDLLPRWEWDELMDCFKRVAFHAGSEFRSALFLGGLDEFAGEHDKPVELVKATSGLKGLKICVSSRPWNVFNDAFLRKPSLRVQDLTENDICRYVEGHFESLPALHELQALNPTEAARLLQEIGSRADGLFLWVDLHRTLSELPRDLEDLSDASAQYFLLLLTPSVWSANTRTSAVTLLLADEDEGSSYHQDFRRLTTSGNRTMGLLEVSPSGRLGFLHRTVLDWAKRDDILTSLKHNASVDFHPDMELLKARITELTSAQAANEPDPRLWHRVAECLRQAAYFEQDRPGPGTTARLVRMLKRFGTTMEQVVMTGGCDDRGTVNEVLNGNRRFISWMPPEHLHLNQHTLVRLATRETVSRNQGSLIPIVLGDAIFGHIDEYSAHIKHSRLRAGLPAMRVRRVELVTHLLLMTPRTPQNRRIVEELLEEVRVELQEPQPDRSERFLKTIVHLLETELQSPKWWWQRGIQKVRLGRQT
ncbi:hypothetical protein C8A03DRAFT_44239 [Achaetomium macrosporum]|uniref:Nephrocystin 3-like N-terminal domain-containing protein n=1 Tax=Achaetomium macrosporum TaxID=79813 RepID=A0AAN7CBI2_9PEZI|nr:hypothetical protein C8A03DRAFT_44239 [Achaetomium macrosporum]